MFAIEILSTLFFAVICLKEYNREGFIYRNTTYPMLGFFAGLGVFLLGMKIMESTLLQYGVPTLKRILRTYTDKKWKSVISGTVLACITQSSTIVSVMTVVFVGAGIVSLMSGVGVIIGANVGSTLLGILLGGAIAGSFKISTFALPMLAVGGISELIFKKKKKIYFVTTLIFSFGLIFYGISLINTTVSAFAMDIDLAVINQWGILGYFLIGVLLTGLMHSSDTMLVITLTFLAQGIINFPEALAIMIGANIGTTISAIEGSWSGSKEQKQVALSHFLFNLVSACIALPLLYPSIHLMDYFFDLPRQNIWAVVMYDFWYNLIGAVLFFPFLKSFVKFLEHLVSAKKDEIILHSSHIDYKDTEKALGAFRQDVLMLFKKVYEFNARQLSIDIPLLIDPNSTIEVKYGTVTVIDEDNLDQDYKVISTLEETLIQSVVKMYHKNKDSKQGHYELFLLREAIERMVYSAKTLRDTKSTIDDLRAAKTPLVNEYLREFKKEMIDLYVIVAACMEGIVTPAQRKELKASFDEIINADENFLTAMGDKVSQEVLSNRQLSSLLHVGQGLNRSHKAIIHTVDILFPEKIK